MSKKIVITGGLGYIGMELSLLLSGESRKNNSKEDEAEQGCFADNNLKCA